MTNLANLVPPGVVSGEHLNTLYRVAREQNYAFPAVNVVNTNSINAALEAAYLCKSPIIIQLSHGGAAFFTGKGAPLDNHEPSIVGAIATAHYVHAATKLYGKPVVLHTDHAAKKLLPWTDGLLEAGEAYYKLYGKPLFSSHMLDFSEESLTENVETCQQYLVRMFKLEMGIEIELGCTGGEEDGVIKMNIDTDTQWASWEGVSTYYKENEAYLQSQIGNPTGDDKPNKKYYDPRVWLRKLEMSMAERLMLSFKELNCLERYKEES
jgi:fructose-bisphosphate aldolase class II